MRTRVIAGLGSAAALSACIPNHDYREPATPPPPPAQEPYERPSIAAPVSQLPAPPPAWVARRVTPDARVVTSSTYRVAAGDTLRAIADRTGASSEAIARVNGLTAPYPLSVGQTLSIPGGRYHLVRAGETGIAIARAYGVEWSGVVTANNLSEPYILRVGQRVLIPGDPSRPATPAERAAAFRLDIDDLVTGSEPAIAANQRSAAPVTRPDRPLPSVAQVATPRAEPGGYIWPLQGAILRRFGPGQSGERNDGIQIAASPGTPVLAAADGVVAYVGSDIPALGGLVILKHGGNIATVYGYASKLLVQRGQTVKRGERIALSGASGSAPRPALHFEVRQGRSPVDPLRKLPPR